MKRLIGLFISCALVLAATVAFADGWLQSIPEFELTDHLGEVHTLDTYQDYDYLVFYVQGVGCPIARLALPNYREVRAEYGPKNIAFAMFNSNIQDDLPRHRQGSRGVRHRLPHRQGPGSGARQGAWR